MLQPFTTASPIQANFSFEDVSSGIGFLKYYGFNTYVVGDTRAYQLSPNTVYSYDISTGNTDANAKTFNFDTSVFTLPRTAKGTAIVNACVAVSASLNSTVKFEIFKVTGVTETSICSSVTWTATAATKNYSICIPLTLTQTVFASGDFIRLKLIVDSDSSTANALTLYHDPKNRGALTDVMSELSLNMPFAIEY